MKPSPPAPALYLASQSPRRRELLTQIGVAYAMLLARADEDVEALEAVLPGEAAPTYVIRVCLAKARAAAARRSAAGLPAAPILSADTTVALDDAILGKPADAADAAAMLSALAGRTHEVLTAVAVLPADWPGGTAAIPFALSVSTVHFAPLSAADIARYVATGEPFGKAGAYGIQGRAATFVSRIHGSYSGIMGLPLFETAALLRAVGVTS